MKTTVTTQHTQRGFTIIEIMVAMVISLILLMGVINIFQASRTSYDLQSGLARLQENARFSLDTIARSITMAGAKQNQALNDITPINVPLGAVIPPNPTQDNFTENVTAPYNFTTALGTASDTLSVNYTSAVDCINNGTGVGGIATDFYEIRMDPATNVPNLYCNGQPLAEGVENMQILYGDDTDGDGVANTYVSWDNVTVTSDGGIMKTNIPSVRIAILVSTVNDTGVTSNSRYQLLNSPPLGPFNDELIRRVYTRTIPLQNYTP